MIKEKMVAAPLPPALKIGPMPSVDNMSIKTNVLEPITITKQECVFALPSEGILDQNSVLILAAVASAPACFPFQTGIRGLVQKAEILIGGRSIASSEDFGHIATLRRLAHVSPEDRVQKDMVLTGALGDRFGVAVGNKLAFRDLVYSDNATAEAPAGFSATADDNSTPLFSLKISELIPMMRSRQLPLGMIKQPVFLKIRFNVQTAADENQGKIVVKSYGDANLSAGVSLSNVVFLADTLFYSPPIMEELQRRVNSDAGLQYVYEDEIMSQNEIPAAQLPANQATEIEREMLLSGKTVRSIFNIDTKSLVSNHALFGAYYASAGLEDSTIQFTVNDRQIYDRPLDSVPKRQQQLGLALGHQIQLPSQLLSYDTDSSKNKAGAPAQDSIAAVTVRGYNLSTGALSRTDIRGTRCYDGLDLTTTAANVSGAGTLLGTKPVRLRKKYYTTAGQNLARTWRTYANVERQMIIETNIEYIL